MTRRLTVDLEGRTALVTGGGTGIGRAISVGLARCGARVVVNYSRSAAEAEATVDEIAAQGGQALALRADVTDEDQVRQAVATAVETYGGLDILMANAGGPTESCSTEDLSSRDWDAGLNLNCKSVFLCVKHAAPHLPDGRGRILMTSSISARSGGGPGTITYTAAKGALNNLVRGWAKEYAPRGITVNAVAPGVVWTRIHQQRTPPEVYRGLIQRIPLGRDGRPEDCVGAALFLASEDASYITGQILEVNGGMLMP